MKVVADLMSALRAKDVSLWVENDQLSYDAPLGALTTDDLNQIRAHKRVIIELLGQPDHDGGAEPPIERADRGLQLPLSLAQQRLWFLDRLEGTGAAYNIQGAVRLRGVLDRVVLKAALDTIVSRHEALRTVFRSVGGDAVQVIANEASLVLQSGDVSALPARERDAAVQKQAAKEALARFDLCEGPLIRALLIRVTGAEHVLLVTMHHIVSDGWSIGVLIQELATLYAAYRHGGVDPLPPLTIQYADYAQWQRHRLAGGALQRHRDYWKEQLAGAPALLELPSDRPRPATQSYAGASISLALSAELTAGLKALARRHNATLFMALYTGWAILLSRLSGQTDVVIGVPVANRQRTELEALVGFFVNTLALRARLDDDPRVDALLRRVKETTLTAYAHQELPFAEVIEAVRPPRSLSHSPVFQVMFALQNTPQGEMQVDSTLAFRATAEYIAGGIESARFDLMLSLEEVGEQVAGAINYASDLFDRATIERWIEHFKAVLAGMVEDASRAVSAVPLLGADERRQVVDVFNATHVDYPANALIHRLFEEQVGRTPHATAAISDGRRLTYAELNAKANQLARYLEARGVGPDRLVAVCLERSLDMVVGLLGVLKAGGAYVPVDPDYPRERLELMLADAAPQAILTQARVARTLPATTIDVIALDGSWTEIAGCEDTNLDAAAHRLTPRHLAYVIYTSGSTGLPKGAMNEHRGVVNRLRWMQDRYRLSAEDRVLQKTPFSFDVSVWEFFWPLLNGAQLVIARPQGHQDPVYLSRVIQDAGVTTIHFVPSMLQAFLDQPDAMHCTSVRHVVCSGEELSVALQTQCLDALPHAELHNLYGPTEAAIDVTAWECRRDSRTARVPIGAPIANTQIYILDTAKQPVPVGVSGEIHIGGAGVGRGYLNRPELTAERFTANPFAGDPEARLYRTGDLGRWRTDGNVEYLGRNDDQVKVRGFRIELGEVEAQLRRHPHVREAAVAAREDAPGSRRLVAYVTAREQAPDAEALRAHMGGALPEYMVPSAFVVLPALPLTPNGKLDRTALPAPDLTAQLQDQYVAPRNPIEEKLCAIWADVLQLDRVGVDDDFFALGGDSILSIRIVERARTAGLRIALEDLFRCPTVARLGQSILERDVVAPAGKTAAAFDLLSERERAPLEADPNVEDAYPLSALQAGMHFHSELHRDSAVYHDIFSLCIDGRFDRELFERAARALVQRHPILRSSFRTSADNRLLQVVHKSIDLDVAVEVISQLTAAEQDQFVDTWMAQEKWQRFVWSQAPLFRVFVHVRGANRFQYTLSFHHAILDGWSLATLQTELFEHYLSLLAGSDITPAAPTSLYRNYVALEQQALQSAESREYWRQSLEDATILRLPVVSDARSKDKGLHVATHETALGQELYTQLTARARELNVSLKALLLSAHVKVMGLVSGQDDVLTGLVSNGRPEEEGGDRALGLYLNSLPLRLQLAEGTWRTLVRQVHELEQSMLPHRRYPLQAIQQFMGGESLINTLFNFVHFHVYGRLFDAGMVKAPSSRVFEQTNFDLMVVFSQALTGDGLSLSLAYDPAVLAREQVERMAGYYHKALLAIATRLDEPHHRTTLLSDAEREQLAAWNATEVRYEGQRLIHALIEQQVEATPRAAAVVHGEAELTYAELNRRANQLARYLRRQGVVPDATVAICLDRSAAMVVGMLGTLKAGGAYVPLDPGYPAERLEYMLTDAAPRVILTQQTLAGSLPSSPASIVALDAQWGEIAEYDDANVEPGEVGLTPDHLAYVIYTSGSTGKPKGVMIEHRNAANFIQWGRSAFALDDLRQTVFSTSITFDLSIFELFVPLSAGGTVHLIESALRLAEVSREATLLNTVPSAVTALVEAERIPASIRVINLAGEALTRDLIEDIFSRTRAQYVLNLYGPTETTTYSTGARLTRQQDGRDPHIGRPIANTQVYILDSQRQLVPVGVPGEMYIGGAGVARGYLNRPELTAERFIADPFAGDARARLYRTGDLARWRPDGNIDYLGRNDHQVKIRGFRIELGEIETELRRHPQVREAVVAARESDALGRHLVAYVCAHDDRTFDTPEERLQVDGWKTVFDGQYGSSGDATDAREDFSVWISSYDGKPLPLEEMRAWADLAVTRIGRLPSERVLEIGCGVGLLLFRLLPGCGRYVGTDFSQNALDRIAAYLPDAARGRVDLLRCDAADPGALGEEQFDTTVLNSVVQYFPSIDYLLDVIRSAIARTRAGGAVFIGDVRNYRLLEAFATSVVMHKAPREESVEAVRQRVRAQVNTESELVIAPDFFLALAEHVPRVSHIEVLPKFTEPHHNELFDYRYDVILHVEREEEARVPRHLDWKRDRLSLTEVESYLETGRPAYLRITSIPNDALRKALQVQTAVLGRDRTFATVGDVVAAVEHESEGPEGTHHPQPHEIVALGRSLSYHVEPSWIDGGAHGTYSLLFSREGAPRYVTPARDVEAPPVDFRLQANNPLRTRKVAHLTSLLKAHVEEFLPEHMHPAFYVVLDALPMTPNGKLDRKALAAAEIGALSLQTYEAAQGAGDDAPQGEIESSLADIWRELLGVPRVGRHDDFFDLGGHSLLAIQVAYRIYVLLGWEMEVGVLFEHPTVHALAKQFNSGGSVTRAPIQRADRDGPLALSPAQRRLWLLARNEAAGAVHQVSQAVRLHGRLDQTALQAALDTIVERHEVLRTVYVDIAGTPLQVIEPAAGFVLQFVDLSTYGHDEREAAVTRHVAEETSAPFDLSTGPVIRGRLIRLSDDEHVFLFSAHSIVYDGWSRGVLLRELGALYAAYRDGRPDPLPPLEVQYADYAQWQNEWLEKVLGTGLTHWSQQLAGAPPLLELPTDRPRPAVQTFQGAGLTLVLSADLTAGLKSLAARHDATLYMTLFTGWAILLSKLSAQDDIVIGTLVANREVTQVEGLIGAFLNYLPMRARLDHDPTVGELLHEVKEMARAAYSYQWVPFVDIVESEGPMRSSGHSPIFQSSLMLENIPSNPVRLPGITFAPQAPLFTTAEFDLALSLKERGDCIDGLVIYATDLFDRDTIERWNEQFTDILTSMVQDAERKVSAVRTLGASARSGGSHAGLGAASGV